MAVDDIRKQLKRSVAAGEAVGCLSLEEENTILSFVPEDMTVRVEAGVRLGELQSRLAESGQWLPLDPWNDSVTIKQIIDENLYGPMRYGFGAIREHLIGMEVLLADGRLVQSGGNVVKNVAGYDLMKLFVGARQSLGLVFTATFNLLPIPACRRYLRKTCQTAAEAAELTDRLLDSEVCPVVLDWYRLEVGTPLSMVTGFAGTQEEVSWQIDRIASLGMEEIESLSHDREFFGNGDGPVVSSVLPSTLGTAIEALDGGIFVARAGNGLVWAGKQLGSKPGNPDLEGRLKARFDPNMVFPKLTFA